MGEAAGSTSGGKQTLWSTLSWGGKSAGALAGENDRVKERWRLNCIQLTEFDAALTDKDDEIAQLKEQLQQLSPSPPPPVPTCKLPRRYQSWTEEKPTQPTRRRGRAPPVDAFSSEKPDVHLDDWLPGLERAMQWKDRGQRSGTTGGPSEVTSPSGVEPAGQSRKEVVWCSYMCQNIAKLTWPRR